MRTIVAILFLAIACALPRAADAGDARARFPQGDAYEGAPYLVTIEIVDAQQAAPPTPPVIPGATVRVLERGRQQSTQIVNGRVSSSTSVTYAVEIVPEKAGTLEIPAIELSVDGKAVRTQARTVTVRASDAAELMTAEVFGQPPEVTIGEPLELVLRIAIKPFRDPNYGTLNELQMWQFVDLKGSEWGVFEPEVAALAQRGSAPRTQQESRNDERWYVYEITRRTWPPKAGQPDIGNIRVRMTYPMELREVQGFLLERELRMTQSRPVSVAAQATGIQVLPLPDEGRPASFAGAVGTFSIVATAKPTSVAVGDPVTVTLLITDQAGTANLETLQPPALAADAALSKDFRVPGEALSGVVSGRNKRFTVTLRPLRAGVAAIPPIEFSSFDPRARRYRTVRTQPIPLTVVPGTQMDLSKIVSADGTVAAAPERPGLTASEGGLVANLPATAAMLADDRARLGAFGVATLAVPPAVALVAIAWRANRSRHERDGSLARRSGARRSADRRLARPADAAAVAAAVTGFVEDSTGRPAGTLTRGDLDAALAAAGVAEAMRVRARDLLARCDRARYAGGAAADPALAEEARALVAGLDASGLRSKGGAR